MADEKDELPKVEADEKNEWNRMLIQHHHEIVMEQWKQNWGITHAVFRDQKDYAAMVLRASLLINGGAAIALLAYIGHVVGETGDVPQGAKCALYIFTAGVGVSVFGVTILAIVQRCYNTAHRKILSKANDSIKAYKKAVGEVLKGKDAPIPKRPLEESHWNVPCLKCISNIISAIIISVALLNLSLFSYGVYTAASVFGQETSAIESECVKICALSTLDCPCSLKIGQGD